MLSGLRFQRRALNILLIVFIAGCRPATDVVNLPANGKIRLFIGQNTAASEDYYNDVVLTGHTPGITGVTLYGHIKNLEGFKPWNPENPVKNIDADPNNNWGAGINDWDYTLSLFPKVPFAIGLAMSGDDNQSVNELLTVTSYSKKPTGQNPTTSQQNLEELILAMISTGREIFLRPMYEVDGPWNAYDQNQVKQVFAYIKHRINVNKTNKIALIWQVAAWPENDNSISQFENIMPSSADFDWFGLSAFYFNASQLHHGEHGDHNFTANYDNLLTLARKVGKPVMIAESTPQGYDNVRDVQHCIYCQTLIDSNLTGIEMWEGWYKPFLEYIYANKDIIRAVAYINERWGDEDMWHENQWGRSRVQDDATILYNWKSEISSGFWVQ